MCRDGSGSSGVGLSLAQGLVSSSKARGSLHHQSMETGEDGAWSEGEGVGRMGRLLVAGREEAHKLATSSLLVRMLQNEVDFVSQDWLGDNISQVGRTSA